MKLAAKKVDPEIPVRWDPHKTFTDGDEGSCLRYSIGTTLA
jgi:hypothetical protein